MVTQKVSGRAENCTELIKDIERAIKYLEDNALLELSLRVLERLKSVSDEGFIRLNLVTAE
ncbi:MAG: hypothetical protein K2H41_04800 [Acetatifactor sp.]|nr:hypothetical protein [Acetatifactor sp.]